MELPRQSVEPATSWASPSSTDAKTLRFSALPHFMYGIAQGMAGFRRAKLRIKCLSRLTNSPLWGIIPYRVAVPALFILALVLTGLLVFSLERWHSALSEALLLGSHPQDIPQSDLVKIAVLVIILGATALTLHIHSAVLPNHPIRTYPDTSAKPPYSGETSPGVL